MIERKVSTVIDADKCIGCGLCVKVCPSETIAMVQDKAAVVGDESLSCGHCEAVCPAGAITVKAVDPGASRYATFEADNRWLPHGECDRVQLVRLISSRRSCRNFKERPVERALLDDLVKVGVAAPSGTNSQCWTFTILPSRESVNAFGDRIALFFNRVNKLAEKRWLRECLRFVGNPELSDYYRDYHQSVCEALADRRQKGQDRLFHGATAVIIVGSRPLGSTPSEDALLAAQNILLAAHGMGLGTCLIGFAVVPMIKDVRVKRFAGIPDDEKVHAVIALGYPDERYLTVTGRKPYICRFFEG